MRRYVMGVPLYTPRGTRGVQRPRSWAPATFGRYAWAVGKWVMFVDWQRWAGYFPRSAHRVGSGTPGERIEYPDVGEKTVKKWSVTAPPGKPEDTPPVVSAVLKKHPRLLAFLHDRWYDDGSSRVPGSIWIDSDLGAAKAMLKEPSLCLCARVRAASLDDLFAAVETFLGLDSPPWEHDQYAAEAQAKKKKK